jgi:hypothetical protein
MLRTAFPAWQPDILTRLAMPQVQRSRGIPPDGVLKAGCNRSRSRRHITETVIWHHGLDIFAKTVRE